MGPDGPGDSSGPPALSRGMNSDVFAIALADEAARAVKESKIVVAMQPGSDWAAGLPLAVRAMAQYVLADGEPVERVTVMVDQAGVAEKFVGTLTAVDDATLALRCPAWEITFPLDAIVLVAL
jgi:hypothetical protein